MDYKYFRGQAVPFRGQAVPSFNGKQRPLVEWLLKTARASDDKKISTSEFVYDFGIPRISAVIFNLRQDLWDIKTIKIGKKHYHELVDTYDEKKVQWELSFETNSN
jgi:hypothetical protein